MIPLYERQPPLKIALQHEWGPLQHRVRHALRVPPTSQQTGSSATSRARASLQTRRASVGMSLRAKTSLSQAPGMATGPTGAGVGYAELRTSIINLLLEARKGPILLLEARLRGWVETDTSALTFLRTRYYLRSSPAFYCTYSSS